MGLVLLAVEVRMCEGIAASGASHRPHLGAVV